VAHPALLRGLPALERGVRKRADSGYKLKGFNLQNRHVGWDVEVRSLGRANVFLCPGGALLAFSA
jgi:hypothetical protein